MERLDSEIEDYVETEMDFVEKAMGFAKNLGRVYTAEMMSDICQEAKILSESCPEYSHHLNIVKGWIERAESKFVMSVKSSVSKLIEADVAIKGEAILGLDFYASIVSARSVSDILKLHSKMRDGYAAKHEDNAELEDKNRDVDSTADAETKAKEIESIFNRERSCFIALSNAIGDHDFNNIVSDVEKSAEVSRLKDILLNLAGNAVTEGMRVAASTGNMSSAMKDFALTALAQPEVQNNLELQALLHQLMTALDEPDAQNNPEVQALLQRLMIVNNEPKSNDEPKTMTESESESKTTAELKS